MSEPTNRKYILTEETMEHDGCTLHRIRAVRDFHMISAGDYGGWVESEYNLSHEGTCWISQHAKVYHRAAVRDYAYISGKARVCDYAQVEDHAHISDFARLQNNCIVLGSSRIRGHAIVRDCATVGGSTHICEDAIVGGLTCIMNSSTIRGDTKLLDNGHIHSQVHFTHTPLQYVTFGPVGSRNDITTFYICANDGKIWAETGCFIGTIEEFIAAVERRHKMANPDIYRQYSIAISAAQKYLLETA